MEKLFDLRGKVALVTGGSRGLGRVMAEGFAHHGADVVIASRKLEACEEVASSIRQSTGRRAIGVGAHVGRWSELEQLVETCYQEFGSIDSRMRRETHTMAGGLFGL